MILSCYHHDFGGSSTSQKFPLVEFFWQILCIKNLHPLILAFPFIPFSTNISRVEFQLVTPMEDKAGNQYFKLNLWGKRGPSLRHPLGGHHVHFHFSPKQNCLEPNLAHFWIYRPPRRRKEFCWEWDTQDEAETLHQPISRAGVTGTAPWGRGHKGHEEVCHAEPVL